MARSSPISTETCSSPGALAASRAATYARLTPYRTLVRSYLAMSGPSSAVPSATCPGSGAASDPGTVHAVPARPVPSDERPEWRVVHRPREAVRARRERLAPGLDPRVDRAVVISHQRRARVLRGEVGSHTREGGERDREAQEDDDGAEVVEEVAAPEVLVRITYGRSRPPYSWRTRIKDMTRCFTPRACAGRHARRRCRHDVCRGRPIWQLSVNSLRDTHRHSSLLTMSVRF